MCILLSKFMLTVSHNDNPVIFAIDREIKYTKKLEQRFESKC